MAPRPVPYFGRRLRRRNLRSLSPASTSCLGVIRDSVDSGQPVDVLAARVLDAVRAGDLWVFPNPEAVDQVQVRLGALDVVVARAAQQDVGR